MINVLDGSESIHGVLVALRKDGLPMQPLLTLEKPHGQTELFEEHTFEIKKGSWYGNYAVWKEGFCMAEFIGLDTAAAFIRHRLRDMGYGYKQTLLLENACVKRYRDWEDTQ